MIALNTAFAVTSVTNIFNIVYLNNQSILQLNFNLDKMFIYY